MRNALAIAFCLLSCSAQAQFGALQPTTSSGGGNNGAPLGTNLASQDYYTLEFPFLNALKSSSSWLTSNSSTQDTNEEQYVQLDAQGYPTTLAGFGNCGGTCSYNRLRALVYYNMNTSRGAPYYPLGASGQYVFGYTGHNGTPVNAGTFTFGVDVTSCQDHTGTTISCTNASDSTGRILLNVTPCNTAPCGFTVDVTATDTAASGNYATGLYLVQKEYESMWTGGQYIHPIFMAAIGNKFKNYRFMDWQYTNYSEMTTWALRPTPAQMFWTAQQSGPLYHNGIISSGVPAEVLFQLCNMASAALCWVNIGQAADDNYVTQFATLAASSLTTADIVPEFQNEMWNSQFDGWDYCAAQHARFIHTSQTGWSGTTTAALITTSTTSLAVPSPNNNIVTLTVGSGLSFNAHLLVQDHSNANNWFIANRWSYSGTTLQLFVKQSGGSGTPTQWDVYGNYNYNTDGQSYCGYRQAVISQLFKTAYGSNSAKVHRPMGNQIGNNGVADGQLRSASWTGAINGLSPPASSYVDFIHDAPYLSDFGWIASTTNWGALYAMGGSNATTALNCLFQYINTGGSVCGFSDPNNGSGLINQLKGQLQSDANYLSSNFPSIGLAVYESGPSFNSSDTNTQHLFDAANNDTRMGTAMVGVYNAYQSITPNPIFKKIYMHFNDVYGAGNNANWGLLYSSMLANSANQTAKYLPMLGIMGETYP